MAAPTPAQTPYAARLERIRARLQATGCDYCLVGPSSDLRYLTGLDLHASERLAVLIVAAAGGATLVVPSFEVHGLGTLPADIEVAAWQESENPAQLAAGVLAPKGGGTCVAVGDQLRAVFLLRLQAALPQVTFRTAASQTNPSSGRSRKRSSARASAAAPPSPYAAADAR